MWGWIDQKVRKVWRLKQHFLRWMFKYLLNRAWLDMYWYSFHLLNKMRRWNTYSKWRMWWSIRFLMLLKLYQNFKSRRRISFHDLKLNGFGIKHFISRHRSFSRTQSIDFYFKHQSSDIIACSDLSVLMNIRRYRPNW